MIATLARRWRALARDRRGTLAVEVAMAMPVLLLLLLSGIEVTRFVLLNQKLERASATMADLVAQAEGLAEGDLLALYEATGYVMDPFDIAADGVVVVSSISRSGGGPALINWQRAFGGGGGGSAFGVEGGVANLPAGFVVRDGESIIASEVAFDYEPVFVHSTLAAKTLYTYAVFRPRFATLTTLQP